MAVQNYIVTVCLEDIYIGISLNSIHVFIKLNTTCFTWMAHMGIKMFYVMCLLKRSFPILPHYVHSKYHTLTAPHINSFKTTTIYKSLTQVNVDKEMSDFHYQS